MSNTLAPAPADSAAAPPPDTGTPPPAPDAPQDAPADPTDGAAPPPSAQDTADPDTRRSAAERIRELVDERNATRDYAEYWRQQALQGRQGAPAAGPGADTPKIRPAPLLTDFKDEASGQFDVIKWNAAHAKWSEEQIELRTQAAVESTIASQRERQERDTLTTSWAERCQAFRAKQPDFDQVTANPTLPIPKSVADVILTLERGPAVFHHLGLNPAEAARIARLAPAQQAVALGRIEERLAGAPAPAPRRQHSNAPPPPAAIRQGGAAEVNMETCSLDDFLKARLKRR